MPRLTVLFALLVAAAALVALPRGASCIPHGPSSTRTTSLRGSRSRAAPWIREFGERYGFSVKAEPEGHVLLDEKDLTPEVVAELADEPQATLSESDIKKAIKRSRAVAAGGGATLQFTDEKQQYAFKAGPRTGTLVSAFGSGGAPAVGRSGDVATALVEASAGSERSGATKIVDGEGTGLNLVSRKDASKGVARSVGRLEILGNGKVLTACTGTLVGPHTVMTAAHCIVLRRRHNRPALVVRPNLLRFTPQMSPDRKRGPYGHFKADATVYPREFVAEPDNWSVSWDMGFVCLKKSAAKAGAVPLASPPVARAEFEKHTASVWSYPAQTKSGLQMYTSSGKVRQLQDGFDVSPHFASTEKGSSGAAITFEMGGRRVAVGVHHQRSLATANMFTRLDAEHIKFAREAIAVCEGAAKGAVMKVGEP